MLKILKILAFERKDQQNVNSDFLYKQVDLCIFTKINENIEITKISIEMQKNNTPDDIANNNALRWYGARINRSIYAEDRLFLSDHDQVITALKQTFGKYGNYLFNLGATFNDDLQFIKSFFTYNKKFSYHLQNDYYTYDDHQLEIEKAYNQLKNERGTK